MAKATDFNPTNRREFLATMAVAVFAGAVMALPSPSSADPIFAAVDAHRDRLDVTDLANKRLTAAGPDWDSRPMQAALWAELAAARVLIGTAPTTRAGLRALGDHLNDDRNCGAIHFIERTVTTDDGYTYTISGGPKAVDWLIAQREAEIVGVA